MTVGLSFISFLSVPDLKQAIEEFMGAWNENPKPFVWTANVEDIIKKIDRARAKVEQIKPGSTCPEAKRRRLDCKARALVAVRVWKK